MDAFARKRAEAPAGERRGKEKKKHRAAERPLWCGNAVRLGRPALPGLQRMSHAAGRKSTSLDTLRSQSVVQGSVQATQQGVAPATSVTSTLKEVRGPDWPQQCSYLAVLAGELGSATKALDWTMH